MAAGESKEEPRGSVAMREHGPTVARVCMALLGDAAAAEQALERIAREASRAPFEDGKSSLVTLLALARAACATQLSKLPIRTTATLPGATRGGRSTGEAAQARGALGKLRPTEREAVVLHSVGGLDAAQVAEACGLDVDTARQRIARGVAQLVDQEKKR